MLVKKERVADNNLIRDVLIKDLNLKKKKKAKRTYTKKKGWKIYPVAEIERSIQRHELKNVRDHAHL